MPPGPPVAAVISRGKCEQLMKPGAAAGIVCQRWKDQQNKPFERGDTLGVGVGCEAILVDAWRAREELIIQLKAVQRHLADGLHGFIILHMILCFTPLLL